MGSITINTIAYTETRKTVILTQNKLEDIPANTETSLFSYSNLSDKDQIISTLMLSGSLTSVFFLILNGSHIMTLRSGATKNVNFSFPKEFIFKKSWTLEVVALHYREEAISNYEGILFGSL